MVPLVHLVRKVIKVEMDTTDFLADPDSKETLAFQV